MTRWFARIVYGVITLLLLLFIFMVTPWGFHTGIKLLQKSVPGQLTFNHISGNIFSPINFTSMNYTSKTRQIHIKQGHLEWRLPMLILGELDIANLKADTITVTQKNSKEKNSKQTKTTNEQPSELQLPLNLSIEKAHITHIQIVEADKSNFSTISSININKLKITKHKFAGRIKVTITKPYQIQNLITLKGELNNYTIKWHIQHKNENLTLNLTGTTKQLNANIKKGRLLNGVVHSTTQLTWYPYFKWKTNTDLENLGKITRINLISSGEWQHKTPTFKVNMTIHAPNASATVKGDHIKSWNLKWNANIHQLNKLISTSYGSLQSSGTITGKIPFVHARFSANQLDTPTLSTQQLTGQANIDFSLQQTSSLLLQANTLTAGPVKAQQLSINLNAAKNLSLFNGLIRLKTNKATSTTRIKLTGKLNKDNWSGLLNNFNVNLQSGKRWHLKAPSKLMIAKQYFHLTNTCLTSSQESVCANLNWSNIAAWTSTIKGKFNNFNLLTTILTPSITINSPSQLNASISGNSHTINKINAQLHSTSGRLYFNKDFQNLTLPISTLKMSITTIHKNVNTSLKVVLSNHDKLQSTLRFQDAITHINDSDFTNQRVEGNLNMMFSSVKLFEMITPYISRPSGVIKGNLRISGVLPLPNLNGNIDLQNGQLNIPSLKLALQEIKINLSSKDNTLLYKVQAKTAKQPITISGRTFLQKHILISHINISGNQLLISNTPQYTIYASPKINVKLVGKTSIISGSITIPKAMIKPADFTSSTSLPDDTVIINRQNIVTNKPLKTAINLKVILGDHVNINAKGLKGQLKGEIIVSKTVTQTSPIANGQIILKNGSFAIQGKKLTIAPGSGINYTHDSISNPHLSVRAYRMVSVVATKSGGPVGASKTQVGVDIKGTVRHLNISLFSTPVAMSQADIISYLLFDSPASGGNASNLSLILSTVSSLKLGGGKQDSSISQIKQKLNITELGIQQQMYTDAFGTPLGVNQSAFVIGSYITPKIFIKYNRGLLNGISIYQVRYIFNKNWAVQAETSSGGTAANGIGTGADILYTISRKHFPW